MKVVLFSQFVPLHLEQTVIPRLKARGVDVIKTVDFSRNKEIPAGDYDTILYMHEMSGHSDFDSIKAAAKLAGKKFLPLSRKSALSPDELRDRSVPVAQ